MLVRLFGKNFRSLRDSFELSMVAATSRRGDLKHRGVVIAPIDGSRTPLRILRVAAIYGPNASGKSTLLRACRALRWIGTESFSTVDPETQGIAAHEPFLLDGESSSRPVELGCDILYGDKILRYQVSFDSTNIILESLELVSAKDLTTLFRRDSSGKVSGKLISESEANQLYVEGMRPNISALSKLASQAPSTGAGAIHPYFSAIRGATEVRDYSGITAIGARSTAIKSFADDADYRTWLMSKLIKPADVGICDYKLRQVEIPAETRRVLEKNENTDLPPSIPVVSFVHYGKHSAPIDLGAESTGTRKLFRIGPDWYRLLTSNLSLLADELSASLHPQMLAWLVNEINGVDESSRRSQLIFATHDTGLMDGQDGAPAVLRPDQIYFTKKSEDGATEVYSLAEFRDSARAVHNIRRRYLSGLYGALPSLGNDS